MRAIKTSDSRVAKDTTKVTTRRRKINPLSPPTTIELRGIRVHFPFRPYKCQETYMTTVLDALLKSENALLESPTGTGKTLCLLCACLAWQRQQSRLLRQAQELKATAADNDTSIPALQQQALLSSSDAASAARTPTIIYASRTHSQLSQVVRELRNTRYRPTHAVLASREQMCVHPKVKTATATSSDINHGCNKMGKERKCSYRNKLEGFTAPSNEQQGCHGPSNGNNNNNHTTQPVMDMEELVKMGKESKVCPFYYTRGQVEKAELVLVPYNYLFDKDARSTTLADIPWDNAVLIFDEAHNLESFASESASFDLSNTDIAGCVSEVTKCINYVQSAPEAGSNLKLENLVRLKALFLQLENHIMNIGHQTAYNGEYMIDIFKNGCGTTHANHEILIDELRKVNDFLMDMRGSASARGSPRLEHFIQCIKRVFGYTLESRCLAKAAFYRVHVSPKPAASSGSSAGGFVASRTISYWCFAPALAMEELANLNVRSILVTSGTLSPLPSYGMELGLNFPHTLENPHIVTNDQIHVRVIGKGVSGKLLTSTYERRKDKDYYIELGNTLVNIAKVTPAGMLVFFPSYSAMESCLEEWGGPASSRKSFESKHNFFAAKKKKSNKKSPFSFPFAPRSLNSLSPHTTPWKRLLSTKAVVVEPRLSADLQDAMSEFVRFLGLPKSTGCILMGVCRGKISEGIDFANEQSRAVVITGLPFPPSHDPKVKMKREYLDCARSIHNAKASTDGGFGSTQTAQGAFSKLSGHQWYSQQAHRAVNQAIGRVIRNQADYGAVLLLDSRFGQPNNQVGLSKWLRPHIQKDEGFGSAIRGLGDFYRRAKKHTEEQAEKNRKAVAAPILQYEYDDDVLNEEENLPTKVAVIKNSFLGPTSQKDSTAYVAPNKIVAKMDISELQNFRSVEKSGDQRQKAEPKRSNSDADFGTKSYLASSKAVPKSLAVQFMAKVKANLPPEKQSLIRRAIVAIKTAGDKKDLEAYLKSATTAVRLVDLCEPFESFQSKDDTRMLMLFFSLLPKYYRKQVEVSSFELVFDNSSFGRTCEATLPESKLGALRLSAGRLLQSLWCRKSDGIPLPTEVYLHEARGILVAIANAGQSLSSMLKNFTKLIPDSFHGPTHAWILDVSSRNNIARMKADDKARVGEGSLNASVFYPQSMTLKSEAAKAHFTTTQAAPTLVKRKLVEPFAEPRPKKTMNPYAKKNSSGEASAVYGQRVVPSVSSYLKKVESDVYINRKEIVKLDSNIPDNMNCQVCSESCKDPLVANCGHVACSKCWLGWLKRSETCMTCRSSATIDTLARVVYQK